MAREVPVLAFGWLLISAICLSAVDENSHSSLPSNPAAGGTIAAWIRELDADGYAVRARATEDLIKAGASVVVPLSKAIRSGSWEVATRGIYVLQELAMAGDPATEESALSALQGIAAERQAPIARRAGEALLKLDPLREQRALKELTRLGARIETEHQEREIVGTVFAIEIGPEWRGQESDLRRLRWLTRVQQVTFAGSQVSDRWMQYLLGMENLAMLKIKRASFTDEAFQCLPQLRMLRYLKLIYVPVGDPSIRHLKLCKSLSHLGVYGTKITPEGAQELRKAIGERAVGYRGRAFLGIAVGEPRGPCLVSSVTPGSAAEKAGLQAGDVIIKYGDRDTPDFESLVRLIADNDVGDTVTIQILRDQQPLTKQITFGEWE